MIYEFQIAITNPTTENDVLANVRVSYDSGEESSQNCAGTASTLEIESVTDEKTGEAILIDDYVTLMVEIGFREHLNAEKIANDYDRYASHYASMFS